MLKRSWLNSCLKGENSVKLAANLFTMTSDPIKEESNELMKMGISLFEENTPDSLRRSIEAFDHAIDLRQSRFDSSDSWNMYGLIGGWINRGDAYNKLGELQKAVESYEQAVKFLAYLPFEKDPLFEKRHATTWVSFGLILQKQGTDFHRMLECFEKGIECFDRLSQSDPQRTSLIDFASAKTNFANAAIQSYDEPLRQRGLSLAKDALKDVSTFQENNIFAAEVSLKARLAICSFNTSLLTKKNDIAENQSVFSETTDLVEEALELARHWETQGHECFRNLAGDIFRFGCRIYQNYQPEFLAEFIWDYFDPETNSLNVRSSREVSEFTFKLIHKTLEAANHPDCKLPARMRLELTRDLNLLWKKMIELFQTAQSVNT